MSVVYTPDSASASEQGSVIVRREAVAESRDSLITHDDTVASDANIDDAGAVTSDTVASDAERVADTKNIVGTMYSMMAGLIEQLTTANMRMEIEMKELRIEIENLKNEKSQIEKSNEQIHKKVLDLRVTVMAAMTREIGSIRKDMEHMQQDTQRRALDEVKAYIDNQPTVETKFQEMMKEHRSALARSIRKTTRPSLDQDLMSNIVEEHIIPLYKEIEALKARGSGASACDA